MRILYVDIDSLRPDHLGCYGYARPTSPHIDRVAAQGVRFSNCYASDTPCVPSRAALFSGRPGIQSGVVAHENTPRGSTLRYGNAERSGRAPMWMHHLLHNGLHTTSFSSFGNRHLAGWFHFGFEEFHLSSLRNGHEEAPEVNEVALPWFEQNAARDNWFVHLNYWDPHTFYTEPREFFERMAAHPAPEWPNEATIQAQQNLTGFRTPSNIWAPGENPKGKSQFPNMPDQVRNRAEFEHLINGYDGAIAYADEALGRVLDELEKQGIWDETAIIISADHGEAFGELGQYMEHGSASPAVNRVPMIVKWPGLTDAAANTQNDELLLSLDLCPTVAEALNLPIPEGWVGRSFVPALRGENLESPRPFLVWSHGLHTRQRAVFDGRWLFLRTYEPSYFEYPPRMLFDLQNDPHQTNNLAEREAARVQAMEAQLLNWEREQVQTSGQSDAMRDIQDQPPGLLGRIERHLNQLREAGREADAKRLEAFRARFDSPSSPYPPSPLEKENANA